MKTLYILLISISIFSCKKKNETVAADNNTFDASKATLIKKGTFVSNVHKVSGNVSIYLSGSSKVVYLENFSTESGPDLKVYLSTATNNTDVKDLGALKANSGKFYYTIDTANTSKYNYVLIWCKQYSVLFGNSELK